MPATPTEYRHKTSGSECAIQRSATTATQHQKHNISTDSTSVLHDVQQATLKQKQKKLA